jgi:hypothetical protein
LIKFNTLKYLFFYFSVMLTIHLTVPRNFSLEKRDKMKYSNLLLHVQMRPSELSKFRGLNIYEHNIEHEYVFYSIIFLFFLHNIIKFIPEI